MRRRQFIKNIGLTAAGALIAPYILPSGRLFAATGTRVVNHVVFVLFAGGVRHQESIEQAYLADNGGTVTGNLMENMLAGTPPSSNLVYKRWTPLLSNPLQKYGTLFQELSYATGPTGHFNGHSAAITGQYTSTSLDLNINPSTPTLFEFYRKHTTPAKSAINAWWLSEGLGPYPALNYSTDSNYGSTYGANFFNPLTTFGNLGLKYLENGLQYQPDDVKAVADVKTFLDANFSQTGLSLPGIVNSPADAQNLKQFINDTLIATQNGTIPWAMPSGTSTSELTGDLINISYAWQVLQKFKPELTVVNTFNLDICHNNFSSYLQFLHKADYGVGWLWQQIQSDPILKDDTIMICMPDHGRNISPNTITDKNGFKAYDHTSDDNSRRNFALIVGPAGKVYQNKVVGTTGSSVGENIDIVSTIAYILGFHDDIPSSYLAGNILKDAFI